MVRPSTEDLHVWWEGPMAWEWGSHWTCRIAGGSKDGQSLEFTGKEHEEKGE